MARSVAHSINQRFTTFGEDGRQGVATPKTDRVIELLIPPDYEHNIGRFFQVLMNIAIDESPDERVNRLDRLDREINDPTTAQRAALRLEAIGDEGVPTLKRALRHPDLEVRFQAAHALAYMGAADGVNILQNAAQSEPAFRWHALAALATVDDSTARTALENLMNVDSAETRYGAFRALQARSPGDRLIAGSWLAGDFHFHVIPSTADPMLHFSRSKRPEIVLFGEQQTVGDDFLYVEAGLTVQAIANDRVQVIRFLPSEGEIRTSCSSEIRDLIQTLADTGVDYTTLVKMFRDSANRKSINTRMVVNAVPRIGSQKRDLQAGEVAPERSERYVAEPLPGLFSDGSEPVSTLDSTEDTPDDSQADATVEALPAKTRGRLLNRIKHMTGGQ